ncbi:MAG: alpha/beta fold hydrolase [Pseudomonadales bacterium]|mgnify:CR=1 FL=1
MLTASEIQVRTLEEISRRVRIECGFGQLEFRCFGGPVDSETLLLVHGGSGSWLHWVRNIDVLRQHFKIWTVDLPGLGASDALPEGYTAQDAVAAFAEGCQNLTELSSFHLVAFSWGCAVSAQAALVLSEVVRSITLIGPASIGDVSRVGGMKPLLRRKPNMTKEETDHFHRTNLAHLMISDPSKIDALALHVQAVNTRQARFKSPKFAKNTMVLDAVAQLSMPMQVIYGDLDGPALPDVASKRALFLAANPKVVFELVAGVGHWLAFEQPDVFHGLIVNWMRRINPASGNPQS